MKTCSVDAAVEPDHPDGFRPRAPSRNACSRGSICRVVSVLAPGFHPAISQWFGRRFPEGPTEPQARGWSLIARGQDTLIAAPTGSGKTLAGFLVAIDSLYRAHAAGQDVAGATRVVYVSPLKALAVDIAQNLERPLAEIAAVAAEMGLEPAPITVAVRTGDTTASQRAHMLRR